MLRDLLKSLNLREKQFSQKGELQPTRITVPFPPQKIGRNAQFSYNIEKRNSRVDENYSKRGENYANFVIFEQRNASILGPIIVSRSEPVRTFASGRREVVLVIVNCGLSNLVFAGGWSGFYFCICNCAVCQLLIAHRTLAW